MAIPLGSNFASAQPRILIADDQPDVLEALRLLLKGHGYVTEAVSSPAALLEATGSREFDLILMDLNYARDTTSGREGLDVLDHLQQIGEVPPIVVMTGWATVPLAVEAMQRGVGDFVEKPWTNSRLLEILKQQIEKGRARRQSRRQEIDRQRELDAIALQARWNEREIDEALVIQKGLLPVQTPQIRGYQISAVWQPARRVGGDYYDFLEFGRDSLGICIADVAGKGLAAAMLMSNLQAAVRGLTTANTRPEELCQRLNALVSRNVASDRFITLFYAHLDGPNRKLCYTNAGHNPPILAHENGACERLRLGGGVLGTFESPSYGMGVTELAPGDRIVLFTDGVTEACGPNQPGGQTLSASQDEEEFGEGRLLELVVARRKESAEQLQKAIIHRVGEYAGGRWNDDATLIVIAVE